MKVVKLLVVTSLIGAGTEADPVREIHTLFTEAGERLGQVDPTEDHDPRGDLVYEITQQPEALR